MINNNNKSAKVRQSLIVIRPKKTAIYLFNVAVFLFVFNLIGIFFQKILGEVNFFTNAIVYVFDASEENNVPTFFSSFILLLASTVLFITYLISKQQAQKNKKYWLLLSFIFLFLSMDEAISIHEQFNKIKQLIKPDTTGYLNYPWILPYGVFVLVVGAIFFRFLFNLPVY